MAKQQQSAGRVNSGTRAFQVSAAPPKGHNRPPEDSIGANLAEANAALLRQQAQLLAKLAKAPKAVTGEAAAKAAGALIREIRDLDGQIEAARVEQKEPYLSGGRAVDGFFKELAKPLDAGATRLNRAITAWQDKIEAERRAEAERVAAEQAAEAARLAKLAKRRDATEETELQAAEAQLNAEEAQAEAELPAADLVRVRDEDGTITRKTEWVCDGIDRDQLDLEALRPYFTEDSLLKAVRAAIRAEIHELAGATIVERKSAMVL